MAKNKLAAQLYTVRQFMKTPADIAVTMKKIKKIGYNAVQLSGLGPIDPAELKKITDGEDLEICATHVSYERIMNETQKVIDEHKLWNCRYLGLGALPERYRESKEGYVTFVKEISPFVKKIADSGLIFVYHNHNFEFIKFDGQTALDIILKESDPKSFNFEPDTYWIQSGGSEPAAYIRKLGKRAPVIHFKDMAIDLKERKQIMAEVGEGNLNWPGIIESCREVGAEWYIVEQDVCRRDPFESLAISLKNLNSMGVK